MIRAASTQSHDLLRTLPFDNIATAQLTPELALSMQAAQKARDARGE